MIAGVVSLCFALFFLVAGAGGWAGFALTVANFFFLYIFIREVVGTYAFPYGFDKWH